MADRHRNTPSGRSRRTARSYSRNSRAGVRDELRDIMNARSSSSASSTSRSGVSTSLRTTSDRLTASPQPHNTNKHSSAQSVHRSTATARNPRGSLVFFVGVIVFLIAALNIVMVFKSYAQNVGQLNALKNQEAELIRKKADLENDISRWSDKAYVTAQARKRLGFVFPGERSVLVKNAPQDAQSDSDDNVDNLEEEKKLSWYNEILYSMESTDKAENPTGSSSGAE
ncbi:septum formation initiator family protein [Alloscardovia omnicolens]|uniref:FtsB family cell division protein n=1 Tax=Alloscardovia omnicolens TaxID=419015 RepID=UPI003A696E15